MKKLKFYGVWLVLIFILGMGFIGCGGGGGGNSSTSTKTSKITQTGYLADSGIEGLFYETSSGKTGITGKDGKYEFIDGTNISKSYLNPDEMVLLVNTHALGQLAKLNSILLKL